MNKLYPTLAVTFACGCFALGTMNVNAQTLNKEVRVPNKNIVKGQKAATKAARATIATPQPQKVKSYSSESGSGKDWTLSSISELKYDNNNNLITEKNSVYDGKGAVTFSTKDTYTYDALGNMTEQITQASLDGKTWENDKRNVKAYDKIRKDVPVMSEFYIWDIDSNNWMIDEENEDGFFLEIERDAQNRVTKSIQWLNSQKPLALMSQELSYGKEGPAKGMKWNALNEEYTLSPAYEFTNMVWKKSDSQYLKIVPNVFYPFDTDENNTLLSYTLYMSNPDGTKGQVMGTYKTTYDEKDRLNYVEIAFPDGISSYKCTYKYDKDANGSFEMNEVSALDQDYDGKVTNAEKEICYAITTLNKQGDIVKEEFFQVDPTTGKKTISEGYGYDMTYKNGLLSELVLSYYSEYYGGSGGYAYLSKFIYSDYAFNTSGVENVNNGPANVSLQGNTLHFKNAQGAHYTVCDFQGKTLQRGIVNNEEVSLGNLPRGMYIVKIHGKKANNAVKLIKK